MPRYHNLPNSKVTRRILMPKLILLLIWIIYILGNTNPPGHIFFDEPKGGYKTREFFKGGPIFSDKYLLFNHDNIFFLNVFMDFHRFMCRNS